MLIIDHDIAILSRINSSLLLILNVNYIAFGWYVGGFISSFQVKPVLKIIFFLIYFDIIFCLAVLIKFVYLISIKMAEMLLTLTHVYLKLIIRFEKCAFLHGINCWFGTNHLFMKWNVCFPQLIDHNSLVIEKPWTSYNDNRFVLLSNFLMVMVFNGKWINVFSILSIGHDTNKSSNMPFTFTT